MEKIEYILNFCENLGKEMIACGANLERVNLTLEKILNAYQLEDISISSFSTRISICAKDKEGNYCHRETIIPPMVINLEKLKKVNAVAVNAYQNTPDSSTLLEELHNVKCDDFPWWLILIGYIVAMACLCRIFAGGVQDVLIAILNTIIMFFASKAFAKINLNHIITNFTLMFISSSIALFFAYIGFAKCYWAIIITNAFYLIPGIPMVNAFRNLICGNELNGIIELLKVALEVIVIVAGLAFSYYCFGDWLVQTIEDAQDAMKAMSGPIYNVELIVISFLCSLAFSIGFNIQKTDLIWAGVGGAVIRGVFILAMYLMPEYRIGYTLIAAFAAALFAEIVCNIKKYPSTILLYPSIVPFIPGDLIYYTMLGFIWKNYTMFGNNLSELTISLIAISLGFIICSSVAHYIRKAYAKYKLKFIIKK